MNTVKENQTRTAWVFRTPEGRYRHNLTGSGLTDHLSEALLWWWNPEGSSHHRKHDTVVPVRIGHYVTAEEKAAPPGGGLNKLQILGQIPGLTLADCLEFFGQKATPRDKEIAERVDQNDEDFEVDQAILSEGDDNGAYVLGWRWCSFEGTRHDKEKEKTPLRDRRGQAKKVHWMNAPGKQASPWTKCSKAKGLSAYTWDREQVTCRACLAKLRKREEAMK